MIIDLDLDLDDNRLINIKLVKITPMCVASSTILVLGESYVQATEFWLLALAACSLSFDNK